MSDRIPDLFVERLAAGELDAVAAEALRERLAAEEGGLARLDALQADGEALLRRVPPRVFAAGVAAREDRVRRTRWAWVGLALAPALGAAVVLAVARPDALAPQLPDVEITRAKGDPALQVHRRGEGSPLVEGAAVGAGDVVQLSYTAAGAAYGAILSLDGRGAVTRHLPARGGTAARLAAGGGVPLEQAYELDDAPDFERFVLITGPYAFPIPAVERALGGWTTADPQDLALDPALRATVFTVAKEGR